MGNIPSSTHLTGTGSQAINVGNLTTSNVNDLPNASILPGVKQAAGGGSNKNIPSGQSNSGSQKRKQKVQREKNRYGSVIVRVASLSSNRRVQERQNVFTITPRGGLFHGTQCNPILVQKGVSITYYY